jgi:dTMP kinase
MGAFVVLEGIDQAGKMTQARLLQGRVRAAGLDCEVLHYPDYETAIGRLIRAFLSEGLQLDARSRCMLFAANRWEKDAQLRSGRDAGALLCVDRYTASNVVYGIAQGLDVTWLRGLESGLLAPDLTLLVDITPEESRQRKTGQRDNYERDGRLLEEARQHYLRLARAEGWGVVPGSGTPEEVARRLQLLVVERLGERFPDLQRALA